MSTLEIGGAGAVDKHGLPIPRFTRERVNIPTPTPTPSLSKEGRTMRILSRIGQTTAGVGSFAAVGRDIYNTVEPTIAAGQDASTILNAATSNNVTSTIASGVADTVSSYVGSFFGTGSEALGHVQSAGELILFVAKVAPYVGAGLAAYRLYNWWSGGSSFFGGGSSNTTTVNVHNHHYHGSHPQDEVHSEPTTTTHSGSGIDVTTKVAKPLAKKKPVKAKKLAGWFQKAVQNMVDAKKLHHDLHAHTMKNQVLLTPELNKKIGSILKKLDAIQDKKFDEHPLFPTVIEARELLEEADEQIEHHALKILRHMQYVSGTSRA